jgi:hypothetical protein
LTILSNVRELGDCMTKMLSCNPKSEHWMSLSRSLSSFVKQCRVSHPSHANIRPLLEMHLRRQLLTFWQRATRSHAIEVYLPLNGCALQRNLADGCLRVPADQARPTGRSNREQNNRNSKVSAARSLSAKLTKALQGILHSIFPMSPNITRP